MKIPNAENAVIDIRKLRDYCLNFNHDEGKHKARLFDAALGMTVYDAESLQKILFQAVKRYEAKTGKRDQFGQRYILDFSIEWRGNLATVRSGWIIEHRSGVPKLTTCFPL